MTQTPQVIDLKPTPAGRPWLLGARGGARSSLVDLLALMGVDAEDAARAAEAPVAQRLMHTGDVLFHEGTRADAVYFVVAGTFKSFRTAEDGYEQVLDFAGRGDVLGFDALCSGAHPTGAIALEESSVYAVLLADLETWGHRVPAFDRVVHLALSSALACRSEHADMMAAVAAEVRLARFLVQLSRRMAAQGHSPRRFRLRMSRRDIASHLGVAHETVSRSFGALAQLGLLEVDHREVEILDGDELKAFARCTRRPVEDEADRVRQAA